MCEVCFSQDSMLYSPPERNTPIMGLTVLIAVGALFAFAGLCALWLIPDATFGKGPKVMMFLFIFSLFGFFAWLRFFVRLSPNP